MMRELARRFRGRISPIKLYDANVCTTTHPPGRSWELAVLSGEPFSKQLRYLYRGRKIRLLCNNSFLHLSIAWSFPSQPMSINEKNLTNPQLQETQGITIDNAKQYPLFTETGNLSPAQRSLVENTEFRTLIRELNLRAEEKLNIFSDEISAYLKRPTAERVTGLIDGIISLADHTDVAEDELDFSVLPRQFHPVIPLIKKWAINDDSDREDFVKKLPKAVLERFIMEVEPYLRPIDSYLDSFGDRPPTEQACALGRLAECAIEVKRHLEADRS
ncbi:MAG: hypothetical protein WBR10_02145 [Candidatus Acidiferrum sp.]